MATRTARERATRIVKPPARKGADVSSHTLSSGNVFTDLELPDAKELLVKAQLAVQIARVIEHKGWTQARAAAAMGLAQPKVSNLLRGRLRGFSTDRLLHLLNRLGRRVEVRISAREYQPEEAITRVRVA